MYKLRTMVPDAESETGPVLAENGDPRVTPVGRLLRSMRIDEVPQLWNVLCGQMSLVGPRPERPAFVTKYMDTVPHYRLRFRLKPGITGMAQVLGRYGTEARDKLRFDLMYLVCCSPLLDSQILVLTLKKMLFPGATGETGEGWLTGAEHYFVWGQHANTAD